MSKAERNGLNYKGFIIHINPTFKLISLTDMWKAAGSIANKKPVQWLRQAATAELLLTFCKNESEPLLQTKPQPRQKEYRNENRKWMAQVKNLAIKLGLIVTRSKAKSATTLEQGTYAVPDLAIAYAEYLSPEFHAWALTTIKERIEEEASPELAYSRGRERAFKGWKRQGKPDDWIQDRINGIENYKHHTAVLQAHGVGFEGRRNGYAECADAINEQVLGDRSKKIKAYLGLNKTSDKLRDHLKRVHLTALSFAEAMADEDIETNNLHGNSHCIDACSKAASRVATAAQGSTRILSLSQKN